MKNLLFLNAGIIPAVAVLLAFVTAYKWLSQFQYMQNRSIIIYVLIQTILAFSVILAFRSSKPFWLRYLAIISIGWLIGDAMEMAYILLENPKQSSDFLEPGFHLITLNNLCWLQTLIVALAFEISGKLSR